MFAFSLDVRHLVISVLCMVEVSRTTLLSCASVSRNFSSQRISLRLFCAIVRIAHARQVERQFRIGEYAPSASLSRYKLSSPHCVSPHISIHVNGGQGVGSQRTTMVGAAESLFRHIESYHFCIVTKSSLANVSARQQMR